ncbi:hypothetical protein H9P43_006130 [Blastocladiella emersonii ATCC 22665]|nr:hypothetical protein H9P43_006130 [Blastocladiella emersonii ATCC 22665]
MVLAGWYGTPAVEPSDHVSRFALVELLWRRQYFDAASLAVIGFRDDHPKLALKAKVVSQIESEHQSALAAAADALVAASRADHPPASPPLMHNSPADAARESGYRYLVLACTKGNWSVYTNRGAHTVIDWTAPLPSTMPRGVL